MPLSNGGNGIVLSATGFNTIGGTTAAARNLISANHGDGILIFNSRSLGHLVEGNYIGTDASGTVALPNGGRGVEIAGVAADGFNTIGGTAAGAGNLISGNTDDGVYISGSSLNVIQGNRIGTDATGTQALGNRVGIEIVSAAGAATIGGTVAGAGNLIAGNRSYGIEITSAGGVLVAGNLIGTDATGTQALGNNGGIFIMSSANTIGGTAAGAGNLISGNAFFGIDVLTGTGNLIQHNYIGTDASGTRAVGNATGVVIGASNSDSSNNTIGGTAAGAGNLVSGNQFDGIELYMGTGNLVQGNRIGTDISGTTALGNGSTGVLLSGARNSTVGGVTAAARNIISGNGVTGVVVIATATGDVVEGNYIGTDVSGTQAVGNGGGVVVANFSSGTTIGGTAMGAGNLISGNQGDGISVINTSGVLVAGNTVGADATGTQPLGNGGNGVAIRPGASNNAVGGTQPRAGNVIAFNGGDGVLVDTGTGNAVLRNRIFANANLGIELRNGGNHNQPAPVLTSAVSGGGFTTIQGSFTGQASTTYLLEFFADTGNPAQGRQFLGAITVTTGADGVAMINLTVALQLDPGEMVTATATDPNGNTSQFSAGVPVTG
jgi:titin